MGDGAIRLFGYSCIELGFLFRGPVEKVFRQFCKFHVNGLRHCMYSFLLFGKLGGFLHGEHGSVLVFPCFHIDCAAIERLRSTSPREEMF